MSRIIHVVQGLSAAGSFRQAIQPGPGELLANEDVLSCGPLPPFRSIDEWAHLREAFWSEVSPDDSQRPFNRDLLANTQALRDALRDADSIVLWLGVGAAEQLLLAWVAQLLKIVNSRARVQLVQFTRERYANAWALGLLNPKQIREHPPAEYLSAGTILELERLWQKITLPDPTGLLSVLSEGSVSLQHSRASLQYLLHRYPHHQTGLGRWESELLRYTKEKGPRVVRVIGHTMGNNFDADMVGDAYLFWRLWRLADSQLAHPLVAMAGDSQDMRSCEVVLTEAGEAVLEGRANAVELNGIDDWVLGVHLDSKRRSVWYHKDGCLVQ
jgi:hypothetical protein